MTASYKIALGLAATLLVFVVGYYFVQDDNQATTLTQAPGTGSPAADEAPSPAAPPSNSTAAPASAPEPPPSLGLSADDLRSRLAAARKAAPLTAPPASAATPTPSANTPPAATSPAAPQPAPSFELAANPEQPAPAEPATATPESRTPVVNTPTIITPEAPAPAPAPAPIATETAPPPSPAPPATESAPPGQPATTYTVQKGDTLGSIAQRLYGSRSKWEDIAQANPLIDPMKLKIDQVLKLPQPSSVAEPDENLPEPGRVITYTVRSGDSLWGIAKKFYGDGSKAKIIHNANRDKIGVNGNNIRAGMKLKIPPAVSPAR